MQGSIVENVTTFSIYHEVSRAAERLKTAIRDGRDAAAIRECAAALLGSIDAARITKAQDWRARHEYDGHLDHWKTTLGYDR